jgi:hypothetical protein
VSSLVVVNARFKRIATATGDMLRRRRSKRTPPPPPPPPPVTTQSSPGQIADLELAYGAEMAPPSPPRPDEQTADD